MAPALTSSNPFRLPSTGGAATSKTRTRPRHLTKFYAKQDTPSFPSFNFRIGGKDAATPSEADSTDGPTKPKRFFFDFNGKIPDARSLVPALVDPSSRTLLFANPRKKDPSTVFVAGATGQAGVRIAQTLLRQGFSVRAGVPDLASAQELARLAAKYKVISPAESKRLNAVESAFDDAETIAKAIGNASKVVVTIGPGENGPSEEVTTNDALEVVRAAQLAGVGHVAVVYDDAGTSEGSTYNVLDGITSFFSNLFSKSQELTLAEFLLKVVETDVSYTLVKAALADDFDAGKSYSVVFSLEGSAAGGATGSNDYNKVSKSQIASLVADIFGNTSVAENKVVEVSTSPSASSKPIDELFSSIPEDGRRKAYREALAKAKAEEEALIASEEAREAAAAARKLEEEVKKLSEQEARAASLAEEARQKAEVAGSSLDSILSKAKSLGGEFSWGKLNSQFKKTEEEEEEEKPKVQIATIRGQAKAWTLPPQKAVVKQSAPPKAKPEVRKVFGGLFKQETIYMDED